MSSPWGGIYLSAINRNQQSKFEQAQKVLITLDIRVEYLGKAVVSTRHNTYIGEHLMLEGKTYSIDIQTTVLASGLLNTICCISDSANSYEQTFNLAPNEPASSVVADNNKLSISILAIPCSS